MRKRRKLLASGIAQLDPVDCGSIISYSICRGKYGIYADMNLSDCNRMISWYFDRHTGLAKIDTVLAILQEFKENFVVATKRRRKPNV